MPDVEDQQTKVHDLIMKSALEAEATYSVARIFFCLAVLIRLALIFDGTDVAHPWAHLVTTASAPLLACAFSVRVLLVSKPADPRGLLLASVTVDALCCFMALLPNVVFPSGEPTDYRLLAQREDIYAWFVIIAASGLRIMPLAAVVSGTVSTVLLICLLLIERATQPVADRGLAQISLFVILLGATTLFAAIIAKRTHRLVRAARTSEEQVETMADGPHDLYTDMTIAKHALDRLAECCGRVRAHATAEVVHELEHDLRAAQLAIETAFVNTRGLKDDFACETLVHRDSQRAEIVPTIERIVAHLDRWVKLGDRPSVTFAVRASVRRGASVLFRGGSVGLHRVFMNLLRNAIEGDGQRAARRFEVEVEIVYNALGFVEVLIRDDGPGIEPRIIERAGRGEHVRSTKGDGTGMGLQSARRLVRQSGGTISWKSTTAGTEVTVTLQPA